MVTPVLWQSGLKLRNEVIQFRAGQRAWIKYSAELNWYLVGRLHVEPSIERPQNGRSAR
jgi:hypothetical protein